MLGDSHAQQYMAALGPIAKSHGWEVVTLAEGQLPVRRASPRSGTRTATPSTGPARVRPGPPPRRRLHGRVPDPQGSPVRDRGAEYLEGIKPFTDAGMDVVGIRDNPRFTINMPECVQKNGPDAAECNVPEQESLAGSSPLDAYRGKVPGLHLMDMSDFICADGTCPAVVGQRVRLQGRQPPDQDVRPDHDPHVRDGGCSPPPAGSSRPELALPGGPAGGSGRMRACTLPPGIWRSPPRFYYLFTTP